MLHLTTLMALLLSACGSSSSEAPPAAAPDPPAVEAAAPEGAAHAEALPVAGPPGDPAAGEVVYTANCLACHQADGTGMGGALGADFVNDATRLSKTDAQLLDSIASGVEGTTMIAWSAVLTDDERRDALAYIRRTFGR